MPKGRENQQKSTVAALANSTPMLRFRYVCDVEDIQTISATARASRPMKLSTWDASSGYEDWARGVIGKENRSLVINSATISEPPRKRSRFRRRKSASEPAVWDPDAWKSQPNPSKGKQQAKVILEEALTRVPVADKAKATFLGGATQHGYPFLLVSHSKGVALSQGIAFDSTADDGEHHLVETQADKSLSHQVKSDFRLVLGTSELGDTQKKRTLTASQARRTQLDTSYHIGTDGSVDVAAHQISTASSDVFSALLPQGVTYEKLKKSGRTIVLIALADIFNHPRYRNQVGGNQQDIEWFRQALTQGFFNPNNPAKAKLIERYRILHEKGLAANPNEKAFVNAFEMVGWFESMMIARGTRPLSAIERAFKAFESKAQSVLFEPLVSAIKTSIYSVGILHDASPAKAVTENTNLRVIPARFFFPEAGFDQLTLQELIDAAYPADAKLANQELQWFLAFHFPAATKATSALAAKQQVVEALENFAANDNCLEQLQILELVGQAQLWSDTGVVAKELSSSYLLSIHLARDLLHDVHAAFRKAVVNKKLSDFDLLQILFLRKSSKIDLDYLPKMKILDEIRESLFNKIQLVVKNDCFLSQTKAEHLHMQKQADFLIQAMPVFKFYFKSRDKIKALEAKLVAKKLEPAVLLKRLYQEQSRELQSFNIKFSRHLRQPTKIGETTKTLVSLMTRQLNYTNFSLRSHYQRAYLFNAMLHNPLKTALGLGEKSFPTFQAFAIEIESLKSKRGVSQRQLQLGEAVLAFGNGLSTEFQFYHALRELLEVSPPCHTSRGSKLKAIFSFSWLGRQFNTKLSQIWFPSKQLVALRQLAEGFETAYADNLLTKESAPIGASSSSSASTLHLLQEELTTTMQSTFLHPKEGNIEQKSFSREVSTMQSDSRHKEAKKHLRALHGHFGSLAKSQRRLQKQKKPMPEKTARQLVKRELQLMHEQLSLETCRHRGLVK